MIAHSIHSSRLRRVCVCASAQRCAEKNFTSAGFRARVIFTYMWRPDVLRALACGAAGFRKQTLVVDVVLLPLLRLAPFRKPDVSSPAVRACNVIIFGDALFR